MNGGLRRALWTILTVVVGAFILGGVKVFATQGRIADRVAVHEKRIEKLETRQSEYMREIRDTLDRIDKRLPNE